MVAESAAATSGIMTTGRTHVNRSSNSGAGRRKINKAKNSKQVAIMAEPSGRLGDRGLVGRQAVLVVWRGVAGDGGINVGKNESGGHQAMIGQRYHIKCA